MNTQATTLPLALASIFVGGLSLSGCALESDTLDESFDDVSEPASGVGLDVEAPASEHIPAVISHPECMGPGRPVIAKASDGDCSLPLNYSWKVTNLFESDNLERPELFELGVSAPPELAKYCSYVYDGPEERFPEAYDELGTLVGDDLEIDLDSAGFDCRGFVGVGEPDSYVTDILDSLHEGFMANVGALDATELNNLSLEPVMLRLLDDAPYEAADMMPVANGFHGLRLEKMIDDIACAGQAPCIYESKHNMALPRKPDIGQLEFDMYDAYGGKVAYWSDVAVAIYTAVASWRKHNAEQPNPFTDQQRLVLNMSLAASMETVDLDSAPMTAVIDALEMAACYGVIVVAAAGNRTDDTCDSESGILAPAVFETMDRPSQTECEAMGYIVDWNTDPLTGGLPVFSTDPQAPAVPLLTAVGGVDGLDRLPANGRVGSHPRLVATASSGLPSRSVPLIEDIEGMPMTGTSVSTAVASGTAKLVWAYNPSLRPDEVLDALYDGGYDIGETAVGRYAGSGVHRLSVFGALQQVGAPVGGVVGAPDPTGNLDIFATATQAREDHVESQAQGFFYYNDNPGPDFAPACETPVIFPGPGTQPTKPVCAICGVESNDPDANAPNNTSLQMTMTLEGVGPAFDSILGAELIIYDSTNQESVISLDQTTLDAINEDPPFSIVKVFFFHPDPVKAILKFNYKSGAQQKATIPLF